MTRLLPVYVKSKKAGRYKTISHSPTGFLHSSMHCCSLVNPLSACLTEVNWRHLIAEGNRLERRATNIGLLCPKVCNNIGGDIPIDVPPTKILVGICPRHPRRRWRQCSELTKGQWNLIFFSQQLLLSVRQFSGEFIFQHSPSSPAYTAC